MRALRWHARQKWIEDHAGWTFADYDAAAAGDILMHEEYLTMQREAEKKARDSRLPRGGRGDGFPSPRE